MRHEEHSAWTDLNTLLGRILVAVIALAVLLFLTSCSEPAREGTETEMPTPETLGRPALTSGACGDGNARRDRRRAPKYQPENARDADATHD